VEPCSITIDSSSTYAYVVDSGSGNVYQYTIGASGVLDVTTVKTTAAGKNPRSITIHPKGKHAYVANSGSDDISQYTIGSVGALSPLSSMILPPGSAPTSITVATSLSGTYYAYVASSGSTRIYQYTIYDGSFQPMATPSVDVGATPYSIAVDPDGKYAYVANSGNVGSVGSVSQYKITGGGLTPMSKATVSAGTAPSFITVDPSGQYVYAANNGSDNISQYKIDTSGADTNGELTPIAAAAAADLKPIFVITVAK
jgi:6-phosphogluconolactonase (cycloisomerase 2 family)